jgi:PAS domain S-box-containing protein
MEVNSSDALKARRYGLKNLFRLSDLSIGKRLTACFVAIVVLMIAVDGLTIWQFRRMAAAMERLGNADQASLAVIRVHLDIDALRDKMAALANSHNTQQFSNEVATLEQTFLQDVQRAEQMLGVTSTSEQNAAITSALETLKIALPSQLHTVIELANAGDWTAVRLRLAQQVQDLIGLSASLVERVNQQTLLERTQAINHTQEARQNLLILGPIAALLTLLAAAALGWYVTRTITVPLSELTTGAKALARGDFQHESKIFGNDELAVLAKSFNYAAAQLQELYQGLRRSEAYLAEAQRLTQTGSFAYDAKTNTFPYWSEEHFRIWGYDPQQDPPDGDTLLEQRVHAEDREMVVQQLGKALRERKDYTAEFRIVLPDGTVKYIEAIGHHVSTEQGEPVELVGTHVDVTARKRADEERERLHQMEADLAHLNRVSMLGELTASLAHEINQPITGTIMNANACIRWLTREEPDLEQARMTVERIKRDGERAAEIITRVRSFYKKGAPPHPELVDLNGVIGEMLELLRSEANRRSVAMRADRAADLPLVRADRVQLQQVLMNLMLNGIEAMDGTGGELTIKSQREEKEVVVSVSDTGVGLPAGKMDEIFNSFFTTKPAGTGMGLSISRSIVESHGGELWATDNDGHGATFQFRLPIEPRD